MPSRLSIFWQLLATVFLAGAFTACVAIFFFARQTLENEEAALVEHAVSATASVRAHVRATLHAVDTELTAAAWALSSGDAARVPSILSAHVAAARGEGEGASLDLARSEASERLLASVPRGGWSGRRFVDASHLAVAIDADGSRIEGLIDLGELLGAYDSVWLEASSSTDGNAPVLAHRNSEEVVAHAKLGSAATVFHRESLQPMRDEVEALVSEAILYAAVALLLLVPVAWLLARHVARPIVELAGYVERGERALPRLPDNEVGVLGAAIGRFRDALAEETRLAEASAAFARESARHRDPQSVLEALEVALRDSGSNRDWRVVPIDELESVEGIDAAAVRAAIEAEARETSDAEARSALVEAGDHVFLPLAAHGLEVGAAIGKRTERSSDVQHVEVLCRTALAAIRTLQLLEAAIVNDKLAVLGRLSASVAHEMNNPLTYVLTNLQLLESELDGEHREMAREAQAGAERLVAIVRDMSAMSRRGSEASSAERLADLVRAQIKVAHARAAHVDIAVEGDETLVATCDRGRTQQVILNLLVNAIDALAGREHAKVVVRLSRDGQRAVVRVCDDGPGIPPSARRKLFDAFFTTKGAAGTGLGLFLSRSFMREQGGDLVLERTGPDGTTFRVELPLGDAAASVTLS